MPLQKKEVLFIFNEKNNNNSYTLTNKRIALYALIIAIVLYTYTLLSNPSNSIISPIVNSLTGKELTPLTQQKKGKEVFGFAPYWTINRLENVDYNTLTTLAYFGVPINADGNLNTTDRGYTVFISDTATEEFKKAHEHGTRVVLTITQMNNDDIRVLMDDPEAQKRAISQSVELVKKRGIDGLNVDFEYLGDPGPEYRQKFSDFVNNITLAMHKEVPNSKVTVSVYASAVKDLKIYDIAKISQSSDGIFMMAYDFAVASSDNAIPTAPLYGYKEGKYWYDVSTAVDDFLKVMDPEKLILGIPWYGYNYPVYEPGIKAATHQGYYTYYWYRYRKYSQYHSFPSHAQTYQNAVENITTATPGVSQLQTGWDELGQVGWKAYYDTQQGVWRMIFLEDAKSVGIKVDFAKQRNLGGVGMWALGFDNGHTDLWTVLQKKIGTQSFGRQIIKKQAINNI